MTAYPQSAIGRSVLSEMLFTAPAGYSQALRHSALIIAGIAVIVIAAKIRIPLWPVPMTMQTFVVLSIGAAYGPRLGLATIIAWLFLGALGANVFAESDAAAGGLSYMAGASGGYLAGFALAALTVGLLARRGWDRSPLTTIAAMAIGNILIYAPGLLWLGRLYGFNAPILEWGLYPFLIGDVVKLALAALAFPAAWRLVQSAKK